MRNILNSKSVFALIFTILLISCGSSDKNKVDTNEKEDLTAKINQKELQLKQKELELKEKELKDKEQSIAENENRNKIIENAKKQNTIRNASECVVISKKAYFYSKADYNFIKKSYLVEGDRIQPITVENNFVYVEYYNVSFDKSTKGWICIDDIDVVYDSH